jgi:hypothetical protein
MEKSGKCMSAAGPADRLLVQASLGLIEELTDAAANGRVGQILAGFDFRLLFCRDDLLTAFQDGQDVRRLGLSEALGFPLFMQPSSAPETRSARAKA